ncbi:guanylate kinase [Acetobacteraceae bacterium]|nr:guanylate kinase [Candidatus Parcubacteria bacterium]
MIGKLVLLMGPAGSGKGTLLSHIRERHPELAYPISWTTRAPRAGEEDGKSTNGKVYHFVSAQEFIQAKDAGAFLEWDHHFNNYYGTPVHEVQEALRVGNTVLQELEIRGVKQLLQKLPREQVKIIFVSAGTWEEVSKRALAREPIAPDELEKRHLHYQEEMLFSKNADFIIENKDGQLEEAKKRIDEVMKEILAS